MFHFFQQIFLHSIFTIFYLLKLWSLECRLVLVFCVVLKLLLTILKCCKVKWSEVKVTDSQVWWPILRICALNWPIQVHTHSSEHTHTVNTHPEQWAAIYAAAPGEQLRVRCLAQGHLVVVLRVERALYIHSPHRQSLPGRDLNSQPLDY